MDPRKAMEEKRKAEKVINENSAQKKQRMDQLGAQLNEADISELRKMVSEKNAKEIIEGKSALGKVIQTKIERNPHMAQEMLDKVDAMHIDGVHAGKIKQLIRDAEARGKSRPPQIKGL